LGLLLGGRVSLTISFSASHRPSGTTNGCANFGAFAGVPGNSASNGSQGRSFSSTSRRSSKSRLLLRLGSGRTGLSGVHACLFDSPFVTGKFILFLLFLGLAFGRKHHRFRESRSADTQKKYYSNYCGAQVLPFHI
jgi:hypothetical protein